MANTKEIEAVETRQLTPLEILSNAMDKGIDADQLGRLMDLHERHQANEAKRAFELAMNAFRAEGLMVDKNKKVEFGNTKYSHATLDNIVEVAAPVLSKHGLSHRWETSQEQDYVTVSCVITHVDGHSERTTLGSPVDDSGKKNPIQAIGSAVTYLERYTFLAATGLASKDQDDDGSSSGKPIINDFLEYMECVRDCFESIAEAKRLLLPIHGEFENQSNVTDAREVLKELGEETYMKLWRAPTKGGIFTTNERSLLKQKPEDAL